MKAIVQERYGSPDDLELRDIEIPTIRDDEVLVRVRAASVHADVWHMVAGYPYVLRVMGGGLLKPSHPVPGTDLAGTVESVGAKVRRFRVGDEVFGEIVRGNQWHNGGAFAELAAAPAAKLAPKPASLTFEEAAAVPTSAAIAFRALRDEGNLRHGIRVLVNGAGGGVGIYAVQIVKAYGARVTAVDEGDKADLLGSLGADRVIDYRREDFTRGDDRYDLILDVASTRSFDECRRVLSPEGKYVLIGHDHYGTTGHRWFGALGTFLKLLVRTPFTRQLPRSWAERTKEPPFVAVTRLIAEGKLRPVVDRTFPLEEVPDALRYLMTERPRGKIVITP